MNRIVVLEPTARPGIAAREPWRPLDTLKGKVVGFIDNSKPNFHLLADDLSELLVAKHGVASVVRHRKLACSTARTCGDQSGATVSASIGVGES